MHFGFSDNCLGGTLEITFAYVAVKWLVESKFFCHHLVANTWLLRGKKSLERLGQKYMCFDTCIVEMSLIFPILNIKVKF